MLASLGVGVALVVLTWWNGVPLPCLVDSGSAVTSLTETAAGRVAHALTPLPGTPRFAGAGGVVGGRWVAAAHVGTAHLGWPAARVAVTADGTLAGYACLLGADLLSQAGAVILDFRAQEVRPWPPAGELPAPLDPAAR